MPEFQIAGRTIGKSHPALIIAEVGINHKKRKHGSTQIFHVWKLPKIALINFVGLLRVKFDLLAK